MSEPHNHSFKICIDIINAAKRDGRHMMYRLNGAGSIAQCEAKKQYLLTLQISRYRIFGFAERYCSMRIQTV